jgi:hypothetical protein
MTGLDTSQTLTDQASLGEEKLRSHPHLEGHPHVGDDQPGTGQPPPAAQGAASGDDVEAAAAHP